jgi:hypothetical protein
MDCPSPNTVFMGFNCYRPGDPDAEFDFRSPYNIVPPNDYIATYCAALWISKASAWLSAATVLTSPNGTDVYYPDLAIYDGGALSAFSWTPTTPCCLNCTILGGSVQVVIWPTPADLDPDQRVQLHFVRNPIDSAASLLTTKCIAIHICSISKPNRHRPMRPSWLHISEQNTGFCAIGVIDSKFYIRSTSRYASTIKSGGDGPSI